MVNGILFLLFHLYMISKNHHCKTTDMLLTTIASSVRIHDTNIASSVCIHDTTLAKSSQVVQAYKAIHYKLSIQLTIP